MRSDLHVHSTASDGTLTPSELVELAALNGVRLIALADHDTVAGLAEATEAGLNLNVTVIPALELSAAAGDRSVHILGYFIDIENVALLSELELLRAGRLRRASGIVSALQDAGLEISMERVLALAAGGSVGRTHVARALVEAGHADTVSDAFERFVGRGKPFYRPKDLRTPSDVVRLIRAAGGLAVLAHPGVSGTEGLIDELVAHGLAGIEAYHVDHTDAQRSHFARMATDRGLLVTGGTDYHSPDAPHPGIGAVLLPEGAITAFMEAGEMCTV